MQRQSWSVFRTAHRHPDLLHWFCMEQDLKLSIKICLRLVYILVFNMESRVHAPGVSKLSTVGLSPPAYLVLSCVGVQSVSASCSVQFLQHGGHVHQAQLTPEVAHDGCVVQHSELPHPLALIALAQVHSLQQVPVAEVPEGDAALASRH